MRSCCIVPALICGAVVLSGCQSEKEYPVSVAEALHRLNQADKEGFRYHRHCGVLFKIDSHQANNDPSVIWTARTSKKAILSFTVSVSPSPNGVTTKISVPLAENGREMYDGTQKYNHPILRQPIRPAIVELVDAAMEKRSFDNDRIPEKDRYGDRSPSGGACSEDSQILDQGFPAEYDDPPGPSLETVRKLAAKNNWPTN